MCSSDLQRILEQTNLSVAIPATRLKAYRLNAASKSRIGVERAKLLLDELPPELLSSPAAPPELLSSLAAILRIDANLCLVIGGESPPSGKPLQP